MRITSAVKLLVLTALVTIAITACNAKTLPTDSNQRPASQGSAAPTDCRTIKHEMGETEICGQPRRIVVLGPYVLEPLLALNVQPVGYADHVEFHQGDYTDPSQQIPYLGDLITQPLANVGLAGQPSIEAILKIQPDLILGITGGSADQYEAISRIAPTLLLDFYEPEQSLRAIALAVNRTEQAEQLLAKTARRIEEARKTFASLAATYPKVALLAGSDLQDIGITTNSAELCSSLIEALGFQLVFPPGMNNDDSISTAPISLETLPQLNDADLVVFLGNNYSPLKQLKDMDRFEDYQLSKLKEAWEENAIAQSLEASKAGRVYFISGYLCAHPGPIGTELYLNILQDQLLPAK